MLSGDAICEVEGDAEALIRMAGGEPSDGLSPQQLCLGLLGTRPTYAPLLRSEAELARVAGEWRIFVRRGVPQARARWLVGHEIAEWWHLQRAYREDDLEARCDALGAALVAPRRVYLSARRHHGHDVRRLAGALRTTQSLVLLRGGECVGTPTAVVRQGGALVRGEDFGWPELTLAAARRLRAPGLQRVAIRDEPKRVGLVAS